MSQHVSSNRIPPSRRKRGYKCDKDSRQSGKHFLREYVWTLNARKKWNKPEAKLEVDDIVWVLEEWTPRGIWPLGRVTRTFTGPDKTARSCEVKTALGFLARPAVKLAHVSRNHPRKVRLGNVGPENVIEIDNSYDSDIPYFAAKTLIPVKLIHKPKIYD